MSAGSGRWAWAEIDVDAIAHNVDVLRRCAHPAEVWAVVKADGYGHGAIRVAAAALDAGAAGLCVALVGEGIELRRSGVDAPILLLSEQPPELAADIVAHELTPTIYSRTAAAVLSAVGGGVGVHVKIDTGMQRVGVAADDAVDLLADLAASYPSLTVEGVYTHLACADEPTSPATAEQLTTFDRVLTAAAERHLLPGSVHAANSAATLATSAAHRDMVRAGIALYGISPGPGVDHLAGELRPALRLVARVSHVKRVAAGSHVSYGWRHRFSDDTTVATLPIGYADGVPRRLGSLPDQPGFDVLIRGRRHPIVGVVTMDQLMVDVGDEDVEVGDEAVLIGSQGGERIRAEDWAARLGTIGYEIVCGISRRVPRRTRRELGRSS